MSSLPTPLRAALGIALTAVDTARDTVTNLPQKAAGLPVAVASQAVQLSLRAQQQYAAYVNKGDELIGAFRGAPEEPPAWATFDGDTTTAEATPARNTAFDRVPDAEDELAELQALDDLEGVADEVAASSLDLLDGSYEQGDGPRPTPGAPDTADELDVTRDPSGDEVIGDDAPRSTAPREPARKATRKVATKASRKTAPAAPVKKAAAGKVAGKAAGKVAKKAAKKAPPTTLAGATGGLPASPAVKRAVAKAAGRTPDPVVRERSTEPAGTDPDVSDTQPGSDRPDEV
ncbi:hypothetical protein ACXR2U_06015 [Jatrophihabitans sp. YIM 134969]